MLFCLPNFRRLKSLLREVKFFQFVDEHVFIHEGAEVTKIGNIEGLTDVVYFDEVRFSFEDVI